MPNNPPAFPAEVSNEGYIQTGPNTAKYPGMTLLDAAAIKALPWALNEEYYDEQNPFGLKCGDAHYEAAAHAAYTAAQTMLTERARRGGNDDA